MSAITPASMLADENRRRARQGEGPLTLDELLEFLVTRYRTAATYGLVPTPVADDEPVTWDALVAHEVRMTEVQAHFRLVDNGCWCSMGDHEIAADASVAFTEQTVRPNPFTFRESRRHTISCVECFWRAVDERVDRAISRAAAGDMHPTVAADYLSTPRELLRARKAAGLLHRGVVSTRWGSSEWRRPITTTCKGCGRSILICAGQLHPFCSEGCRSQTRSQARTLGEPDERACEVCDEKFRPARRDARYCSGRCRQEAYRRRRAGLDVTDPIPDRLERHTIRNTEVGDT